MSESLDILLVQPELMAARPKDNRDALRQLADPEARLCDLVVFPETFTTGFLADAKAEDEDMDGPTIQWMTQCARDWGAAVCGSAVIRDGAHRYNRFLLVDADGCIGHYDKRHLFGYGGEDQRYAPGAERVVFDLSGWRLSPQVCYDLRFPVWCRNRGDFDLQIFVANWPEPRVAAWNTLLAARAIENQAFVVGVNRVGTDHRGNRYPGASAIYDPLGAAVVRMSDQPGVCRATINRRYLEEIRESLPFQADADPFEFSD